MTDTNGEARDAMFPRLTDGDIVVRQAEALVQRYLLLDEIGTIGGLRADLVDPGFVRPELVEQMVRQLVPWIDYWPSPIDPDEGWPIAPGVRIEALCYSPVLDPLRDSEGRIGGKRVWRMPETAAEFARQFWIRAGFGPEPAHYVERALADAYRVSPAELGTLGVSLGGTARDPQLSVRLLLSRHFEAASDACEDLKTPDPNLMKLGFRDTVGAFERLAELERIGMIVREVGQHAHLRLPPLVKLLADANASSDLNGSNRSQYSDAVASGLADDPTIRRFCEMAAYMADIDEWMLPNASARAIMAGAAPDEDGQQILVSDIAGRLASSARARTYMLEVLGQVREIHRRWEPAADPQSGPVVDMPRGVDALREYKGSEWGQRQSPLNGNTLFRFYGLDNRNNMLASALLADVKRSKGTRFEKKGHDDVRHAVSDIAGRIGRDGRGVSKGVASVVHGSAHSKLILPEAGQVGSAARSSQSLWRDRYQDEPFWANFAYADTAWVDELPLGNADRAMARSALASISHIAAGLRAYEPKYATRAIADLATGVSAISVNPMIVSKIRKLAHYNAKLAQLRTATAKLSPNRQSARKAIKENTPRISLGQREIPGLTGIMRHTRRGRKR